MFHYTHSYIAARLYKSQSDLLLVGSIIPDLAVMGIIKWQGGLHGGEAVKNFSQFIQGHPDYLDLYRGVLAHNILDDFTHIDYKGEIGYAFQNNQELADLIGKYYELNDDKWSIGKAHNFIESAVDILLLNEDPTAQDKLKKAIKTVNRKKLSELFSDYFNIDKSEFLESISQFFDLFTKYDFTKEENWVLFWEDLEKLMSLKDIGSQKRKELLDKSISIVKNTYKDFLNYSLAEGVKQV